MKRVLTLTLAMLMVVVVLFGCSAHNDMAREPDTNMPSNQESQAGSKNNEADGIGPPSEGKDFDLSDLTKQIGNKIIKTGNMEIETLDFDNAITTVIRKLTQVSGYIESSKVEGVARDKKDKGRTAWYRLRIPSNSLEQFMVDAGNVGNVLVSENDGKDISSQYYDTEARLRSLRVREQRLLAIMQQATSLSNILELERELADLLYEIERHTGTLLEWDTMVEYSTLEIFIQEVKEIIEEEEEVEGPKTLWDRTSTGFTTSLKVVGDILEHLLLFIVVASPFIVLFGLVALIVYIIVKLANKKTGKDRKVTAKVKENHQEKQRNGQKQVKEEKQDKARDKVQDERELLPKEEE